MKCEVCGKTDDVNVIQGHACCGDCDGEFCFRCGRHPVELIGDNSLCERCDRATHTAGVLVGAADKSAYERLRQAGCLDFSAAADMIVGEKIPTAREVLRKLANAELDVLLNAAGIVPHANRDEKIEQLLIGLGVPR